jgi:hypothetical protein
LSLFGGSHAAQGVSFSRRDQDGIVQVPWFLGIDASDTESLPFVFSAENAAPTALGNDFSDKSCARVVAAGHFACQVACRIRVGLLVVAVRANVVVVLGSRWRDWTVFSVAYSAFGHPFFLAETLFLFFFLKSVLEHAIPASSLKNGENP